MLQFYTMQFSRAYGEVELIAIMCQGTPLTTPLAIFFPVEYIKLTSRVYKYWGQGQFYIRIHSGGRIVILLLG